MAHVLRRAHPRDRADQGLRALTVAVGDRIRAANADGRLALGVYLIPGFPDWESSAAAVCRAVKAGVDFVEFPVLAGGGWSSGTGSSIAGALERTAGLLRSWSPRLAGWLAPVDCAVGIVYDGAWARPDLWSAAPEALRASSALLLEDDPPDWPAYARQAQEWGVPLVCAVAGSDPDVSDSERANLAAGGGFAYVSLGRRTGERSARADAVGAKVAAVREVRPDLPVCCAFGIREPGDVGDVHAATGCDGVIVGTAAIEALGTSAEHFGDWLDAMLAATRTTG